MFYDPTIVGSWPALAARLDGDAILVRWAATEPAFAGLSSAHDLLAVWEEDGADDRRDAVLAALLRLAAVDGGRDDDALLLTLHLFSGLAHTMARQLADLNPDILAVVVGELTCQIRRYPWRRRPRAIAANLRAETRRAVLADLRLSSRYHPDRVEVLTATGDIGRIAAANACEEGEDLDVVDLLQWAVRSGVDAGDVALLIATECSRDRQHRRADQNVAAAHGITTRTLYRRRNRTLTALRGVAPQYLAAVA
ncbi:hypothetical protein [Blastococcus xanthinilyticus]|uniref:Uncharacterized protein n=1 Tax=Blastococcus xanthinilyticus TaxID=1564164 RepID=A0A5S5CUH3_9ACTN|nr:hypothetical protein [Blastococcus xanthinilyticus]TYP87430.1 hypothetical protein BD833_10617 [Blastococcus xanthinilyticus]